MLPVPNGLAPDVAALTEPMAVAWHAVRRGEVGKRQVAIVIGCGPVGLGVILMLKAKGVRTVVASDFSAGRRALATACGADVVVDPGGGVARTPRPAIAATSRTSPRRSSSPSDTREKLGRLPVDWWHVWRLGEKLGAGPKHPVIFECVGVPGVIESIIDGAPLFSRVVVVGVCVGPDRFKPAMAINKEIDLRFVVGYTPLEFRDTLHMLAEGEGRSAAADHRRGRARRRRRGLRRARRPGGAREDPDRPAELSGFRGVGWACARIVRPLGPGLNLRASAPIDGMCVFARSSPSSPLSPA